MKATAIPAHEAAQDPIAALNPRRTVAEIVNEDGKAVCGQPPLGLLIDDVPGRQIIGHQAPGRACSRMTSAASPSSMFAGRRTLTPIASRTARWTKATLLEFPLARADRRR